MAEIKKRVWSDVVIKALTKKDDDSFLAGVPDMTRKVEGNDIIHLHQLLTRPAVTINGVLPVAVMRQQYENIPISLDTLRTENTAISDDDLYASAIDKVKIASESHTEVLAEKRVAYAAWGIAPTTNVANATPVFLTTGAVDPLTGEKMMTKNDIKKMKTLFDKMQIPKEGRVLVLSTDHTNHLIDTDAQFEKKYNEYLEGKLPPRVLGFEIHEYVDNPYYVKSTLTKKSFGSTPTSNDRQCSFAFYKPAAFKAWGSTKIFANKAEEDVYNEEQLMHLKQRAIARAILQLNIGAIIGD